MDKLYQLFAATIDPNANTRKAAELEMRSLETSSGMISSVFQLSTSSQADISIRQASSIYLKNRIHRSWDPPTGLKENRYFEQTISSNFTPIDENDKQVIRTGIIQALVEAPPKISSQLASAFGSIVRYDYPKAWGNELIQQVGSLLTENGSGEIADRRREAGMIATLELVRAFRWIHDEQLLASIVIPLLPTLLSLGQSLLSLPSPTLSSPEVGRQLHLITKIYKTSLTTALIPSMQEDSSILPWGQFLISIITTKLDASITDPLEEDDEDERESKEWFKAKKWSTFALNRLFMKYGNPSQLPPSLNTYKPFAERFVTVFAPEILRVYLGLIEGFVGASEKAKSEGKEVAAIRDGWVSKKVRSMISQFLTECVKPKSTWLLLKPHVDLLIQRFVFPSMCFSSEDSEQWEDSPVEFVRAHADAFDEVTSTSGSASNFLTTVATKRTKNAFMPQLEFITKVMNTYQAAGNAGNAREKEGALHMTLALNVVMLNTEGVESMLEPFFQQHVIPEMKSQHKELRFRSVELVRTFGSRMAWKEESNLEAAFQGTMACLSDPELPVRVQAAEALAVLIDHSVVRTAMAPNAGRLMQELLKLSDETDLDVLTQAKEKIVANFSEELLPFAVEITQHMANSFMRLVRENMASADAADGSMEGAISFGGGQEEDKMFAALGCLNTLYQVLSIAEDKPDTLAQLELIILPIVLFTIENSCIELFDDAFDLTDMLSFYRKTISPQMWEVFTAMYKSFKSDGVDFLSEMLSTFDNVISFGGDVFRQNPEYRGMLLDIFHTAMTSEQLGASDQIAACKLADCILLNLKGAIDDALPEIMKTLLVPVIQSKKTPLGLKKWGIICLLDCLYYSLPISLQVLESTGATTAFFTIALQSVDKLTRVHEKKVGIVCFLSILSTRPEDLPESIKAGMPQILAGLIQLLKTLPEAMKKRREAQDAFESNDFDGYEDEDESADLANDYDDNDIQDKDNEYLEVLAQEGARLRAAAAARAAKKGGEEEDDEFDDEFEDDDDEEDEEPVYESPLDDVRVFDLFRSVMGDLQTNQSALFQSLTSNLSPEQQSALQAASAQSDDLPVKNDVPGLPQN